MSRRPERPRTAQRPRQLQYVDHDARREDVTFMADTGETYERAATRLGITVHAFEKWCDRHAPDLRARLRANERQTA